MARELLVNQSWFSPRGSFPAAASHELASDRNGGLCRSCRSAGRNLANTAASRFVAPPSARASDRCVHHHRRDADGFAGVRYDVPRRRIEIGIEWTFGPRDLRAPPTMSRNFGRIVSAAEAWQFLRGSLSRDARQLENDRAKAAGAPVGNLVAQRHHPVWRRLVDYAGNEIRQIVTA